MERPYPSYAVTLYSYIEEHTGEEVFHFSNVDPRNYTYLPQRYRSALRQRMLLFSVEDVAFLVCAILGHILPIGKEVSFWNWRRDHPPYFMGETVERIYNDPASSAMRVLGSVCLAPWAAVVGMHLLLCFTFVQQERERRKDYVTWAHSLSEEDYIPAAEAYRESRRKKRKLEQQNNTNSNKNKNSVPPSTTERCTRQKFFSYKALQHFVLREKKRRDHTFTLSVVTMVMTCLQFALTFCVMLTALIAFIPQSWLGGETTKTFQGGFIAWCVAVGLSLVSCILFAIPGVSGYALVQTKMSADLAIPEETELDTIPSEEEEDVERYGRQTTHQSGESPPLQEALPGPRISWALQPRPREENNNNENSQNENSNENSNENEKKAAKQTVSRPYSAMTASVPVEERPAAESSLNHYYTHNYNTYDQNEDEDDDDVLSTQNNNENENEDNNNNNVGIPEIDGTGSEKEEKDETEDEKDENNNNNSGNVVPSSVPKVSAPEETDSD